MKTKKILFVLDAECSLDLTYYARRVPVWLWDTPANRHIAAELWSQEGFDFELDTGVTMIETSHTDSIEKRFFEFMDLLEDQYPGEWDELEVRGLTLTSLRDKIQATVGPVDIVVFDSGSYLLRSSYSGLKKNVS